MVTPRYRCTARGSVDARDISALHRRSPEVTLSGLFEPYGLPAPRVSPEHSTPGEPGAALWSKRVLVDVSHAIEEFAIGTEGAEPMVVVGMFQRPAYFRQAAEVYRRIAALGATTVVGIAEDFPPSLPPVLPPGVTHVLLADDEPLAQEWSVTVLTPDRGATLVAIDREEIRPDAVRLDAGRVFEGSWSFLRDDAHREAVRLREAIADRVDPLTLSAMDEVLRIAEIMSGSRAEGSADRAARHLADRLATGHDRIEALRHAAEEATAEREPRSGMRVHRYLDSWLEGSAPGSTPLGVLVVHVPELFGMRDRLGARADRAAQRLVGSIVQDRLQGADRAVSLSDGDVAVLLPGRRTEHLSQLHAAIVADLAGAAQHFPYVDLSASAVALVTRERPLPLADMVTMAGGRPPDRTLQLVQLGS